MAPEYKNSYSRARSDALFAPMIGVTQDIIVMTGVGESITLSFVNGVYNDGATETVTVMSGIGISTTLQFTNGVLVSSLSGAV